MTRFWIAVASADHVGRGRAGGFMQVSHGKSAPLKRIKAGDRIVYYSPSLLYGVADRLQCFTAIGTVRAGEPYQVEMSEGFRPYRRDVEWMAAEPAAIAPLLAALECTRGKTNWGYQLRFGLLEISGHDFALIADAMKADAATAALR